MKLAPLTKEDLEFIKWRIWEPLRRNPNYKDYYANLEWPLGKEESDELLEKWGLMYSMRPDISFDELLKPEIGETKLKAKKRIQGLFLDIYTAYDDDAAFEIWPTGEDKEWIKDKKYLPVAINFERGRNQILRQAERICKEWLAKRAFYGIEEVKHAPDITSAIIVIGKAKETKNNMFLILHINLERSTKNIIERLKEIIKEHKSQFDCEKLPVRRLSNEKWALYFRVYDMERSGMTFNQIAKELNMKRRSVNECHKMAWIAIYIDIHREKAYRKIRGKWKIRYFDKQYEEKRRYGLKGGDIDYAKRERPYKDAMIFSDPPGKVLVDKEGKKRPKYEVDQDKKEYQKWFEKEYLK